MRKIFYLICLLFLLGLPSAVLALDGSQVSVPPIYIEKSALPSADAPPKNFPLKFTVQGPQDELKEIKMIKLSVQTICAGTFGFHLQEGNFQPAPSDYQDNKIEGSLNYQPTQGNSCEGKRNIILYFCNQADNRCLYLSTEKDFLIAKIEKEEVIEIGDNPPKDDINPPVEPGDEPVEDEVVYDPLLPGEGKFLTIWDLLARIVQIMLGLASVVAVAVIIISGYQYITSSGIPDKAQIAKSTLTYAIIGLILIMIMYVIMRFVLPFLGVSREVIWF